MRRRRQGTVLCLLLLTGRPPQCTGGINAKNVVEYLKSDKIFCCGGSWMVKGDMIKAGEFDKIKKLVAEAAAIVKEVRG